MPLFSHVMVGTNDIDRSKRFYDALFATLDTRPGRVDPKGRVLYFKDGGLFMLTRPIDGGEATPGNGMTIGFTVTGPEQAEAWHKAGIDNGGTAIEDPPGVRDSGPVPLFLAYLRDPDGNKLCALYRIPE